VKVYVLYRPKSDHARRTEEFVRDFKGQHSVNVEVIDVDSRDGVATASLYDVLTYPTVLVMTEDGQLLKTWSGEEVPPLMNELASYAYS